MLRYRPSTSSNQNALAGNKTAAMERSLILNYNLRKRRSSLIWGLVNLTLLGFFIYDLTYKCPLYTSLFNYCEYVAVVVFSLNTLYHFCRYCYFAFKTESINVTTTQRRLLGYRESDTYCNVTDQGTCTPIQSPTTLLKTPNNSSVQCTPLNWSAVSWRTSSSPNDSQNFSVSSPSWAYYHGAPEHSPQRTPSPLKMHQIPDTSNIDFIADEKTLKVYLADYDNYEKALNASNPPDQTNNLLTSFWNHPVTQNHTEISPYLRKTQYQLATQIANAVNSASGISDESRAVLNIANLGNEIWRKLQIDPDSLVNWNANLRMWISQTILERLVDKINSVNEEFLKLHLSDVRIGNVGLERLRKTAQTNVIELIPSFVPLLSFLEITPNQEYLVKRIKELTKGGCMSEFKWNSGGSYNGKPWDESLVNDSEIIIHFLATYLDYQLLPLPNQPDAKPFSKEHFIRPQDKIPANPLTLAIHQVAAKPPHFRLIVGEEVFEVAKGHNNLFYTVLLFLHFVNQKEYGMLGKVNMGRSGANMLWIIDVK